MKQVSLATLAALLLTTCATPPATPPPSLDRQLDHLTAQVLSGLSGHPVERIAVIEFPDLDGRVSDLGRYLSEELITRLHRTGRFEVVERQLLNAVLAEHRLHLSGLIDPESARTLGRILGVDAIATGTLTDLGDRIRINARLIATESGSVFSVAATTIQRDPTVARLLGNGSPTKFDQPAPPDGPDVAATAEHVVEVADFRIAVTDCRLRGRTLTVHLTITNLRDGQRDFIMQYGKPPIRLHDDRGNEYRPASLDMANRHMVFQERGSGYQGLSKTLVGGVPAAVRLTFAEVWPGISKVALLEINAGKSVGMVRFYALPVAGEEI